jgi:fatty-acid peroxygenase
MDLSRRSVSGRTVSLLAEGYGWLPNLMRRSGGSPVQARLMGRRAVGLRGPDAVEFFYDEKNVRRHNAVPEPVVGTLFGKGAVHTLDGDEHAARKAMFLSVLTDPARIRALVDEVTTAWDEAVTTWPHRSRIVLFDQAAEALTEGVHRWAGVPLEASQTGRVADDLVALVDGFATLGPRHWRARLARGSRRHDWRTW